MPLSVSSSQVLNCMSYNDTSYFPYSVGNCSVTEGIPEIDENFSVSIFPNPSSGFVSVLSLNNIRKIEILNLLGETIFSLDQCGNRTTIDFQMYPNGVYFIRLVSVDQEISTHKLIIGAQND